MAITVGTDTYVTLAEANTYVDDNYISTSTKYTTWSALTDSDKEIYLKKATKKIDRQLLRGLKAIATQTLEFPRAIQSDYGYNYIGNVYLVRRFHPDYVVETEVSQAVKDAQVEEALGVMSTSESSDRRAELQAQGVTEFSLGNLSEKYAITGAGSSSKSTDLASQEAKELLRYYISGAMPVA